VAYLDEQVLYGEPARAHELADGGPAVGEGGEPVLEVGEGLVVGGVVDDDDDLLEAVDGLLLADQVVLEQRERLLLRRQAGARVGEGGEGGDARLRARQPRVHLAQLLGLQAHEALVQARLPLHRLHAHALPHLVQRLHALPHLGLLRGRERARDQPAALLQHEAHVVLVLGQLQHEVLNWFSLFRGRQM